MKDLMAFRSQIYEYVQKDWSDVIGRAVTLWAPQYRKYVTGSPGNLTPPATSVTQPPVVVATGDASPLVAVAEADLLDLWIPGRICHIYSVFGQYKMTEVPQSFPTLRKIELQGNIFRDHAGKSIFDGLLEVRDRSGSIVLIASP